MKIITACAAAAVVVCPLSLTPGALSEVETTTPTGAPNSVGKGDRLDIGAFITGPAIIEQFDATTVIPPGWTAKLDGWRNLILQREF